MHGEKLTIYGGKLFSRDTAVVFTLEGDILSIITDYDFIKTDSPDAKQINYFLDEIRLDIHPKGRSLNKNLVENL